MVEAEGGRGREVNCAMVRSDLDVSCCQKGRRSRGDEGRQAANAPPAVRTYPDGRSPRVRPTFLGQGTCCTHPGTQTASFACPSLQIRTTQA